jgi:DNA anti-recombination protein RmuC
MKIKMLIPAVVIGFMAAAVSTSCNRPSEERLKDANEKVDEERQDVNKAIDNAQVEWEKYKADAKEKIRDNDEKIAKLKDKMRDEKADAREKHQEKIAELEAKNNEMRRKIDEYKYVNDTGWQEFKREFNHDMDQLGHSIDDIFSDNVK